MSRPLNKVELCESKFVPGCVAKYEYPVFFFPSLSKAILKIAELPALCDVASPTSRLFVSHFAMSAFKCIYYLKHRINKQRNTALEFFSVLLTFDHLKQ